jgi:hypothetical protein
MIVRGGLYQHLGHAIFMPGHFQYLCFLLPYLIFLKFHFRPVLRKALTTLSVSD